MTLEGPNNRSVLQHICLLALPWKRSLHNKETEKETEAKCYTYQPYGMYRGIVSMSKVPCGYGCERKNTGAHSARSKSQCSLIKRACFNQQLQAPLFECQATHTIRKNDSQLFRRNQEKAVQGRGKEPPIT